VATLLALASLGLLASANPTSLRAADPLPSWHDTGPKQAIIAFVQRVTDEDSPDRVPVSERIAVFDNDGNLWSEQPMYFQAMFILDRIQQLAPQHPEWQNAEPFASVLNGNLQQALAGGEASLLTLAMATHAGMTTDEFDQIARKWISTFRHPQTGKLLTEMVYQPMLELLEYLRQNGFKTYIVSGGGIEFMRPWSEATYGIPPEQVIGSSIKTQFEIRDGIPVIVRLPELNFIDDKAGKPAAIQHHIGRRPLFASGNSDGDLQMMQWTAAGSGPRFCLYLHHTDADREWAYDRDSHVGRLDQGLTEARANGWTVISMKDDWKEIWRKAVIVDDAVNSTAKLEGKWLAEDIMNAGVVDRAQSTLEVQPDGTVAGNTAVNQYRGKATIDGRNIQFGPLATTRRAGPPALMNQESKFLAALDKTAGFRIDERGLLFLLDAEGNAILRFSKLDN
jgi:heat shock protein HslJ/phosphoserine phosphatase